MGCPVSKWFLRASAISSSGPYEQTIDVGRNNPSESNSALPYLWARKRLSRLIDFLPRRVDEDTRQQVTQLGLNYRMLTRFTSFVAVHEMVRNTGTPAKDVKQPLPLPKHVDEKKVLKNVSLTIEKGKTVALVGQSGSGKTTFVDLLPRFYDVADGQILEEKAGTCRALAARVSQNFTQRVRAKLLDGIEKSHLRNAPRGGMGSEDSENRAGRAR